MWWCEILKVKLHVISKFSISASFSLSFFITRLFPRWMSRIHYWLSCSSVSPLFRSSSCLISTWNYTSFRFSLSGNLCDFHEFSNWRGLTLTDSWELDDLLECCDTSSNRRMTHTTRAGSIHPSHRQWLGGNLVMIFTTEIEGESKEGWHDGGERIFDNFYCYSFPLHDDEYIFLVSQLSLPVSLTMWCM